MLRAAGARSEPEQIGISRRRPRRSYWRAGFIRRRYTVLDRAHRAGLVHLALEATFGDGGYWPMVGEL